MKILEISSEYLDRINEHGINTYPNECCGFFFGNEEANRIVTEIVPVTNSRQGNQARRFEISPTDYIQAENYALNNNLM